MTTERELLRHNPANGVTVTVERLREADGQSRIRKELRAPRPGQARLQHWDASDDPRHWNYWRREAEAYASDALRESLVGTGLTMPEATVEHRPGGAVLWLEDVGGRPGPAFDLADHGSVAEAVGRWQARGPLDEPWASRSFLRTYSDYSGETPWHLLDDNGAWEQALIRDCWPAGLRTGWRDLLALRPRLLDVMESLPRTRCHLDLWVSNEIRRPEGTIALLDWAFVGDGAIGEDVGNHVPDAVLDLFWPAERLSELDAECHERYLAGLRAAGWSGAETDVRLGMVASCVKYTWLLPRLLERAAEETHAAYHRPTDSERLFHQRGLALQHLVSWSHEAVALADL